jgi:hypothetical protein
MSLGKEEKPIAWLRIAETLIVPQVDKLDLTVCPI